jgi:serine/threonine-protein kinase
MNRKVAAFELLEPLPARFHYRARGEDGEIVALQVLPAWRRSAEALARFERELLLEQRAQHENVAAFISWGSAMVTDQELVGGPGVGEVHYIARELVVGQTVANLISSGPPPLALSISVAIQASRGLGALHAQGVVHRNVRPDTLALREDGVLKLFDFGLVKLLRDEAASDDVFRTAVGQVVGAAGYMAPEQLAGEQVDERCDLFALGCVLYELVCGRSPFPAKDLLEYFRAVREDEPAPLQSLRDDVPESLDRILGRLLRKRPEQRYATAAELEADLLESLGDPRV